MDQYLTPDPDAYCFIDTETLSAVDLKASGAYVYSEDPTFRVMIVTYAIGDGPVQIWKQDVAHEGGWLDWMHAPEDLWRFAERVAAGEAYFVAWNAGFDRLALSRGVREGQWIKPEHFLDAMAQGVRSHLPPDLAGAGAFVGAEIQKRKTGRKLIGLFCIDRASPADHPEQWEEFCLYALDDIPPMRTVWQATMSLPVSEWQTYWLTERVNERGVPMDVDFARRAADLATETFRRADAELAAETGGDVPRVTMSARLLDWCRKKGADLPEVDEILTREMEESDDRDEDDKPVYVAKYSLGRAHVSQLITFLEHREATVGLSDDHLSLKTALEIRLWGGSSAPRKFASALAGNSGGRLRGQFVFNGAPATGRWSSRGVQVQNLSRATVGKTPDELEAIDMIVDMGAKAYDPLARRFGPVGRTLSRLIRPLFVPEEGYRLAVCDWSAIEARVLPWLAGEAGDEMLQVFRDTDEGKTKFDVYVTTAAGILGKPAAEVTKDERQGYGKVPVLALGFAGGRGALHAMAGNYGVHFDDGEAGRIVETWRATNPWATGFWEGIWKAVTSAMQNPGDVFAAGRAQFVVENGYMSRTLVATLPSGRMLLYPKLRYEDVEKKDPKTGHTELRSGVLTYRRGRSRAVLHKGVLAENLTQATAACLLRAVLPHIEDDPALSPIMLVHDEVVCEVLEGQAEEATARLRRHMLTLPAWAEGLPVNAEAEHTPYYSKTF
jgi:DNA polymerase